MKFLIIFLISLAFLSCSKKTDEIVLDKEDYTALSPIVKWAVVTEPYVPIRSSPDSESDAVGYCRKGDVLKIDGLSIEAEQKWYLANGGYLKESSIKIYSNKYRAENESKLLAE